MNKTLFLFRSVLHCLHFLFEINYCKRLIWHHLYWSFFYFPTENLGGKITRIHIVLLFIVKIYKKYNVYYNIGTRLNKTYARRNLYVTGTRGNNIKKSKSMTCVHTWIYLADHIHNPYKKFKVPTWNPNGITITITPADTMPITYTCV